VEVSSIFTARALVIVVAGPALVAVACGEHPPEAVRALAEPLATECPSAFVDGIDLFDGQGAVDWPAVAASGVRFAIVKATQGTYDTQATFAANWAGTRSAGVARGAYHFFDPTEDGASQAAHFLAVVGSFEPDDLPPVLDIECPDGDDNCLYPGATGAASAAEIHDRMWDFLRAVAGATGRVPLLYTFGSYFSSNAVDVTGLDAFPLFLAYPADAVCLDLPAPWSRMALWQYSWTGEVAGIAGAVDRDRWVGAWPPLTALSGMSGSGSTAIASASSSRSSSSSGGEQAAQSSSAVDDAAGDATEAGAPRGPVARASTGCSLSPGCAASPRTFGLVLIVLWLGLAKRRLPWRARAC
jgi:lysozyme